MPCDSGLVVNLQFGFFTENGDFSAYWFAFRFVLIVYVDDL